MQELIRIGCSDWELVVIAGDQQVRYANWERTLSRRGKTADDNYTKILFSKEIDLEVSRPTAIGKPDKNWRTEKKNTKEIPLDAPLFFDNTQYHFHWLFNPNNKIENARIKHRLARIENAFVFKSGNTSGISSILVGTLNTRNDIGWLKLGLSYVFDGVPNQIDISIEVISAKIETRSDLPLMYKYIDSEFPLWRFRLERSTKQDMSRSDKRDDFPIMWLAQFESLRLKLVIGLKIIANSPHSRLVGQSKLLRADRLKGKIHQKTEERINNDFLSQQFNNRYEKNIKTLSLDTPENQFIKMVCQRTLTTLTRLHQNISITVQDNEESGYSGSFLDEIEEWQKPISKLLQSPLFRNISDCVEVRHESLVLQQRQGYSTVYRVWLELRYYLDQFDSSSNISTRSIDKIYEIWCFLEIRRILKETLQFKEVSARSPKLRKQGMEVELTDGIAGTFEYEHENGISVSLAHEPSFGKNTTTRNHKNQTPIRTYWLTQRPDIFLKATFDDGREAIWLFDAKYRVDQGDDSTTRTNLGEATTGENKSASYADDLVPEDALNQLHRYRDVLIREEIDLNRNIRSKSRPVVGAFALYPGFHEQDDNENPYHFTIEEVGIGAFSLLPSGDKGHHNIWLTEYLQTQLLTSNGNPDGVADHLYVQEPARIPYHGMSQHLHSNLVLIAALGDNRESTYLQNFKTGMADWYHMPVRTLDARYTEHVTRELEYIAIAYPDSEQTGNTITYVWEIEDLSQVKRSEIKIEQSGARATSETAEKMYWLFQLGNPLLLKKPVSGFPQTGFTGSLKISTLSNLSNVTDYSVIQDVYEQAIISID